MVPTPYASVIVGIWKSCFQIDSNEGFSSWKADPENGVGLAFSINIGGFDFTFGFGWASEQYR